MDELEEGIKKGVLCILRNGDIFFEFYRLPFYNDEPKIFHFIGSLKASSDHAAGVSFQKDKALVRVIGESIERYSLGNYDKKRMILKRFSDLENKPSNLNKIISFSQSQLLKKNFQKFRFNSNSLFYWIKGTSLFNKTPIFIPSQLVFVPFKQHKKEPIIREQISTGAAAGASLETATYRGICEIIERDAFMIHYLNRLPSPKVDLKYIDDKEIVDILHILERYRLKLVVLDITTDIPIPVYVALLLDKTGFGPAVSVGLKAGFNFKETLIGAVEESLMTRSWIRDTFIFSKRKLNVNKEIITIMDRAFYWFPIKRITDLSFWLQSRNIKRVRVNTLQSEKNRFDLALSTLNKQGFTVVIVNITPEKIRKFGFSVIKAIIPELHPLYLDERYRYLGGTRIYEVPVRMGFLKTKNREEELNQIPHPFL